MSDLARFLEYARAFELAQAIDDFSLIEPFFAADAVHFVAGSGPLAADDHGREAVVGGLRASVQGLDRRFDLRVPEILEGPVPREDGVWMRFGLRMQRAGLPDLVFEGEHLTRYDDAGAIVRIDEKILGDGEAEVAEYLAQHDHALRPAASPVELPGEAGLATLRDAQQRSLVRAYGHAKSARDADAALAVCHPDFRIDTLPFRLCTKDREDTRNQLAVFFAVFPDYRVETEGVVAGADGAAWWGTMRVTFAGALLGIEPTGRASRQPAFSAFDFKDGLLSRERFYFDLGTLCENTGMPAAELERALALLR